MNKFLRRKSVLALGLLWLSTVSLFVDGANLTDIYSGVDTIHFDECNGPAIADQIISSISPSASFVSSGARHPSVLSRSRPVIVKRAILDQDSPSLAAISVHSTSSYKFFPQEEHLLYDRVFFEQSIYLSHCTLLL